MKINEYSMREFYSHAYHPNRSEGFFAEKVILVEGATEQYSIPIYATAMGLNFKKKIISLLLIVEEKVNLTGYIVYLMNWEFHAI